MRACEDGGVRIRPREGEAAAVAVEGAVSARDGVLEAGLGAGGRVVRSACADRDGEGGVGRRLSAFRVGVVVVVAVVVVVVVAGGGGGQRGSCVWHRCVCGVLGCW